MARLLAYSFGVKQQSLSLRLPPSVLQWIEAVRGDTDRADYIVGLLTERMEQERIETKERERWLAKGRAQYNEEVCRQALQINEEFPIHEE